MNLLDFAYSYVLKPFFNAVFSFYKVEITGKNNIPADKGFILAINHSSYLDGPFVACSLYPRAVHWIVAKGVYNAWYLRPFCVISRSVPVNGSINLAEELLNKGKIIGIFPEGGICCTRTVIKGRKGVAVLAFKTGAPVVPCFIEGKFDATKKLIIGPKLFTPLKLKFGKPIYFGKYPSARIPRDILGDTLTKVIRGINALHEKE